MSNIKKIDDLISKFENYTMKDSVQDRLNKVLLRYIEDIDRTCDRIIAKRRRDIVIKELAKNDL